MNKAVGTQTAISTNGAAEPFIIKRMPASHQLKERLDFYRGCLTNQMEHEFLNGVNSGNRKSRLRRKITTNSSRCSDADDADAGPAGRPCSVHSAQGSVFIMGRLPTLYLKTNTLLPFAKPRSSLYYLSAFGQVISPEP